MVSQVIVGIVAEDIEDHAPEQFRQIMLQAVGRSEAADGPGNVAVAALRYFPCAGQGHGRDEVMALGPDMLTIAVEAFDEKDIATPDADNSAEGHANTAPCGEMHCRHFRPAGWPGVENFGEFGDPETAFEVNRALRLGPADG